MQIPVVNQSTDYFSICTIGTNGTNRPFVQVSNGLHVLMICISPMVYQWNAKSLYWYQSYHWYQWTNGIPLYSNRTVAENSLSPLNEMQFTNGVPMECQVTLLVPIVPLVPMDERNPAVLQPNCSENSISPLNEMQFTNGVPMECQSIPLDSVCVYWTTL